MITPATVDGNGAELNRALTNLVVNAIRHTQPGGVVEVVLDNTGDQATVSVRDGRRIVTDGPYAETKEILGGYFLIEAPDLDAAIEAAARIPGAQTGKIEIRPILGMP